MVGKYAYVVSANERYLSCLNVLLNSLQKVGNIHDVYLISWNIPQSYLDKLSQLSYKVIVKEISNIPEMINLGEGECLMRYRYKIAADLKEYNAVCVLDADTLIARDLTIWFDIAANSEVIVGCGLEQKRWYGQEPNQMVDGKHFIEPTWNDKDICCSPFFFNPNKFGDALDFSWKIVADYSPEKRFKAPDMDGINMAIIKYGYKDRVIALAEATWSGLHETLLKPFSHVCEMHDNLWTINGEEIWLVHGQYLNEIWRGWQIEGQDRCIDRELDGSPRCKFIMNQCMEYLHNYFEKVSKLYISLSNTDKYV